MFKRIAMCVSLREVEYPTHSNYCLDLLYNIIIIYFVVDHQNTTLSTDNVLWGYLCLEICHVYHAV